MLCFNQDVGVELPNQLAEVEFPNELMGDRIAQSARGSSRDNAPTIFFNIMINEFAHITYLIILYLRFCFLKNTMVIEKLCIYLFISGLLNVSALRECRDHMDIVKPH